MQFVRVYFDGSYSDKKAGAGFAAFCSDNPGSNDDNWKPIAWMSMPVVGPMITAAELEAAAAAHYFLAALLADDGFGYRTADFFENWRPEVYAEVPH